MCVDGPGWLPHNPCLTYSIACDTFVVHNACRLHHHQVRHCLVHRVIIRSGCIQEIARHVQDHTCSIIRGKYGAVNKILVDPESEIATVERGTGVIAASLCGRQCRTCHSEHHGRPVPATLSNTHPCWNLQTAGVVCAGGMLSMHGLCARVRACAYTAHATTHDAAVTLASVHVPPSPYAV